MEAEPNDAWIYSTDTECLMLLLAGSDLPEIKLQDKDSKTLLSKGIIHTYLKLFSFEDIAVGAARLTWTTRNSGVETTSTELCFQEGIDLGI
jgi:hypothetical protein